MIPQHDDRKYTANLHETNEYLRKQLEEAQREIATLKIWPTSSTVP